MKSKFKKISFIISIVLMSLAVSYTLGAWQEPTSSPPEGNVSAPINISSTAQTKSGGLTLQGDFTAPIFYDADDSSYYVNPAGESVVGSINIGANYVKVEGSEGNTYELRPNSNEGTGVSIRATTNPDTGGALFAVEPNGSLTRFNLTFGDGSYFYDNLSIDRERQAAGSGLSLDVGGTGRFAGTVEASTPTADDHVATKGYVDDLCEGFSVIEAYNLSTDSWEKVGDFLSFSENCTHPDYNCVYDTNMNEWQYISTISGVLKNGVPALTDYIETIARPQLGDLWGLSTEGGTTVLEDYCKYCKIGEYVGYGSTVYTTHDRCEDAYTEYGNCGCRIKDYDSGYYYQDVQCQRSYSELRVR